MFAVSCHLYSNITDFRKGAGYSDGPGQSEENWSVEVISHDLIVLKIGTEHLWYKVIMMDRFWGQSH